MIGYDPAEHWPAKGPIVQGVAGEGRQIHVTGQVAFNRERHVVGKGDVGRQMRVCFSHIERILAGFGGGLGDIVMPTVFNADPGQLAQIRALWAETFDRADTRPACVMIQVAGLVDPDLLIELVPTVLIPEQRFKMPPASES